MKPQEKKRVNREEFVKSLLAENAEVVDVLEAEEKKPKPQKPFKASMFDIANFNQLSKK